MHLLSDRSFTVQNTSATYACMASAALARSARSEAQAPG